MISDSEPIMPSISTKRPRVDETIFKKLPRSSTNDNFKSKNTESDDSDLELDNTIDKLNSTHLSSDNALSEHEIDPIDVEFDLLKKSEVYQKKFKIKKQEYPFILKLKDFTDSNGLRYYSDKIKNIEVNNINDFVIV